MHLYSKKIEEVSWQDVEDFCSQKVAENPYLDYKADFPEKLHRTIAAMANTHGGVILLGVSDDGQGKPVTPIAGIAFTDAIQDRIMNIIVSNISPPIIPEIAVCPNANVDKAAVLIRIHPSEQTPHVMHKNTRVYVRTGNRNKPEDLAEISRIDWLKDKRRESVKFRDGLLFRASERFRAARDGLIPGIPRTEEGTWGETEEQPALLTLALCPSYPTATTFATPPDLNKIRREITIRDYFGTGPEFPLQDEECINRLVEDGLIMHFSGRGRSRTYHTHLNVHGLYLFKQSLLCNPVEERQIPENVNAREPIIRGSELLCRMFEVVESGAKFYDRIGYSGPLHFRMRLENLIGLRFRLFEIELRQFEYFSAYSADPKIDLAQSIATYDLNDGKKKAVLYFAERVGWAFNWHITDEFLDQFYEVMTE